MTLQRISHQGDAATTGLASSMTSTATSFTVLSGIGYPDGTVGPFVVAIDPGATTEEKILCSARSGNTFTVATNGRGYDGTTASAHSSGSDNVDHVLAAVEVDDDNDHIYTTTRDDHTQYARADGTRAITGQQQFSDGLKVSGGIISASGITTTLGAVDSSGTLTGTALIASGLTGATAASRIVGATTSGAPTSGTFALGDTVVDQSANLWVCTAAGTPGTWVQIGTPIGTVQDYCGTTAPTGWLLADGSAVSRSGYPVMFALFGTTFGAGDGSTTFNLPDLRSSFVVGAGSSAPTGLTPRALGAKGGEEDHQLTVAELATHNHGVTDPGHSHTINDPGHAHGVTIAGGYNIEVQDAASSVGPVTAGGSQGTAVIGLSNGISIDGATTGVTDASATTGVTTDDAGSNTAHNNMPPYLALTKIIKAG